MGLRFDSASKHLAKAMVFVIGCCASAQAQSASDAICEHDDQQVEVCVGPKGAQRVLSLAPHLTEIIFWLGKQQRLLAVDESSNYPPAVASIKKIPAPWLMGAEVALVYKPDLVLVWNSGISPITVEKLRRSGVPVFVSEPTRVAEVSSSMRRIGRLMGAVDAGHRATQWLSDYESLGRRVADARTTVFYQVWPDPLMTLGGRHVVSEVIEHCGGRNIFQQEGQLALTVSRESVLKANPDFIISSGGSEQLAKLRAQWSKWRETQARDGARGIHVIPNDLLQRQGPRLLEATSRICRILAGEMASSTKAD